MKIPLWLTVPISMAVCMAGLWNLLQVLDRNEKARIKEECARIAEIAEADDYLQDQYTCYIINDNKIEKFVP